MKKRLAFWAMTGLLIGVGWVVYAFATMPDVEEHLTIADRAIQFLAYVTCPVAAAGVRFYWVPVANAASYALVGIFWESIQKKWS